MAQKSSILSRYKPLARLYHENGKRGIRQKGQTRIMGIPSYYRKLVRTCPRLIQTERGGGADEERVQWFYMDYNCLIYHCLYRPGAPVYPGKEGEAAWIPVFLASVMDYTVEVIRRVNPEKGVYLAVDGVVPMAKMRQQRLRRFTSAWLAEQGIGRDGVKQEQKEEKQEKKEIWDTNAITPGTAFMDQLHEAMLSRIRAEGKEGVWRVSSCREWGEGEHKILAEWRRAQRIGATGPVAIYGLDADLIVLSLLGAEEGKENVWLFREAMERGEIQYDLFGQECYEWFSVGELRRWLVSGIQEDVAFVYHYVLMMSFLGNDFLPSALGDKMRDDGHAVLVGLLREQFQAGHRMLQEDGSLCGDGLRMFFRELARGEAVRIGDAVGKKRWRGEHAKREHVAGSSGTESTGGMYEVGHLDWPLSQQEEAVLEVRGRLAPDWQPRYLVHFFPGLPNHPTSRDTLCRAYLYGIQWVWAYYTGRWEDVCFEWYYPYSLPPLWEWLAFFLESKGCELPPFAGTVQLRGVDLQPTEQLALVLPLRSWNLLPPCPQRVLPYRAPHLFPTEFSFHSVGKRFFWECEAMIPMPTVRSIKQWCS